MKKAILFVFLLPILGIGLSLGADRVALRVEVVDAFGRAIERGVHASLADGNSDTLQLAGGSPFVFRDLLPGRYQLEIRASGFRTRSQKISIVEREQVIRIGLGLASIGDPEPSDITVLGTVTGCSKGSPIWIKLVGIFTDETASARVEADCSFQVRDLQGGFYIALLLLEDAVKEMRTIKVTNDPPPLTFGK